MRLLTTSLFIVFFINVTISQSRVITENDFKNCIELSNKTVRVVLEPNIGGRVLKYELNGVNILYVDTTQNGLTKKPKGMYKGPSAGRFDFGPTRVIPKHDNIWWGKWEAEITGDYSAKMTSVVDSATGVQLVRDFTLSEKGSKLVCTQTIINRSNKIKRYCFWGRTFVQGGGGTCFVPLNPNSRYPKQYISYQNKMLLYEPEAEENLSVAGDIFVMNKESKYKKYIMDGEDGWMAYLSKSNFLFVKKFLVYPEKKYAEMTACTMSVWFNEDKIVEIEPMGPWEWINPGETSSFTEEWYLQKVDYISNTNQIESIVDSVK